MKTRKTSWTVRASTDLDYPLWICTPCGQLYGRKIAFNATWHNNQCGVCGEQTHVTEPRDFGYLKDGWQNHKRAGQ